ncbi:MAG: hypothetical protein LUC40_07320, partial [Oscillospiraceae bacterium]|nr:hypothetical protein [Oscillospiraceae bacterium]
LISYQKAKGIAREIFPESHVFGGWRERACFLREKWLPNPPKFYIIFPKHPIHPAFRMDAAIPILLLWRL